MKGIFHSFRKDKIAHPEYIEGCKTALVVVKDNMYVLGGIPVFISAAACRDQGFKAGDIVDLGDNVEITDMIDRTNNLPMMGPNGTAFKVLKVVE